jgi:hypothetical protein
MTTLFAFLATAAGKWIVGALGVVIAILAAWLKGRLSGAKAERAKQAEQETAARDIRDQVQNDIGAMPADKVRAELAKRAAK